ncbi:MAG: MarC family protein [Bacteroidota bacterium]
MDWNLYLNFFAGIMAIVNPIGIWPLWSELTNDEASVIRKWVAFLVVLTSYFILLVFLFGGRHLLDFFSVDLAIFKTSGGILVLLAGISMVKGTATQLSDRDEFGETTMAIAKQRFRKILVPMGIPALAGPGSITTVMIFGSQASNLTDYLFMGIMMFLAFLTLFLVFLSSKFLEKYVDDIVFSVFTRLFGIMVTAIALQFILEGLGEALPKLMSEVSTTSQ